tara:strand:+ start:5421 stop:5810 length:390 start_codon:yes stop_codon:yes gene_type:complete
MKKLLSILFGCLLALSTNAQDNRIEEEVLVDPIELLPTFPGGMDSVYTYINRNNQWYEKRTTVSGTVIAGFIVNEKGEISDIKILKKLYPTCDKEAVRLIENMPNWIPAKENGKTVSKRMVLPIRFSNM